MKVSELIERLEQLDPDYDVMIPVPKDFEVFAQIKVGGVYRNEKVNGYYCLHPWTEREKTEIQLDLLQGAEQ
jgi:hypothetical protein